MEEKYLVCYPVYKFQVTSDQPRYNKRWDKSVSVCHNAILQTNILFKTPGMHSASRMDLMASNAPLHECLWNVHVDQGWKNSGITKVDHKKHMIWSNTQTIFFNLSIFLSRQGPSHCHSFSHWCGAEPEASWLEAAQADRNRPHAHCAAPSYKDPFLLTSISFLGNISLSKQRHRNHASKECYVCIFCRHLDCWTKSDTSGMRPSEPLAAPAQARARAHQESCRTEDVTSAGEDKLTPM